MTPRMEELGAFSVRGLARTMTYSDESGPMLVWRDIAPSLHDMPGVTGNVAYGVVYDSVPHEQKFTYMAGVEVDPEVPAPENITTLAVPAGRYAVYTFDGHINGFKDWLTELWQKIIPESGLELRDAPMIERYDERWDPKTSSGPVDMYIAVKQ